jgi:hypothetical protein
MLKVMQDFMKKQKGKIHESSRNQLSFAVYNKEKKKQNVLVQTNNLVSQNVLFYSFQSTIAKTA